jgi:hypothetical protein
MCCLNVWLISNTPATVASNWLQYIFVHCGGDCRNSNYKQQTVSENVHVFITFTPYQALSGNVSVLHSVRAGSNTGQQKILLFVIFLSPSERTFRGYLKRGYNRFIPHRFRSIHYSLHSTLHSPELQTASWYKTTNTNCSVQVGGAQHFSIGQLTTKVAWHRGTKVFKHVNILKHQLILFILHLSIFNKNAYICIAKFSIF